MSSELSPFWPPSSSRSSGACGQRPETSENVSRLRQNGVAIHAYATEHQGQIFSLYGPTRRWPVLVAPYLGIASEELSSVDANNLVYSQKMIRNAENDYITGEMQSGERAPGPVGTFLLNKFFTQYPNNPNGGVNRWKFMQLDRPSQTPMLALSASNAGWWLNVETLNNAATDLGFKGPTHPHGALPGKGGRMTYLMFDGSAQTKPAFWPFGDPEWPTPWKAFHPSGNDAPDSITAAGPGKTASPPLRVSHEHHPPSAQDPPRHVRHSVRSSAPPTSVGRSTAKSCVDGPIGPVPALQSEPAGHPLIFGRSGDAPSPKRFFPVAADGALRFSGKATAYVPEFWKNPSGFTVTVDVEFDDVSTDQTVVLVTNVFDLRLTITNGEPALTLHAMRPPKPAVAARIDGIEAGRLYHVIASVSDTGEVSIHLDDGSTATADLEGSSSPWGAYPDLYVGSANPDKFSRPLRGSIHALSISTGTAQ